MKKKIMAILVAASLCMSMSAVAFAADNTADVDPAAGSEDVVQEDAAESVEDYGIVTYDTTHGTFSTATSINMGTWYNGSNLSKDEGEYWTFTLPTSGRIGIYVEAELYPFYVYTYGYNGTSTTEIASLNAGGGGIGSPKSYYQSLDLVAGTYYLYAERSIFNGSDGTYQIKVEFTSANESFKETETSNNNTAENADSISLNTTYKGQLAKNDAVDYYKFTINSNQDLIVAIDQGDTIRANYYIYESSNIDKSVWNKYVGTEESIRTAVSLPAGTYYLRVNSNGENQTGNYSFSIGQNLNGVCKASDGNWYNYKDGVVQKGVTVAKNSNGWWYIDKNGKVDFNYTGFASNSNGKWYCENGKVTFKKNGVIKDTTGAIGTKGTWYYVTGSQMQSGYTGVANYKNSNGWWYIKSGKVDFSANTVAKNKNGWWYVTGGKVQFGYTGVANYKNSNGWWYIKNGKVDFSYTGRAKNKNGTWNVVNGKVRF